MGIANDDLVTQFGLRISIQVTNDSIIGTSDHNEVRMGST